jgi:flagellar biosynthesis protein FlhF
MLIKKYVGSSVPETLQKIKEEWGKEAVILNTKVLPSDRLPNTSSSHQVEITAAIEPKAKPFSSLRLVRKGESETKEVLSPKPFPTNLVQAAPPESELKKILSEILSLKEEWLCWREKLNQFLPEQTVWNSLKLHLLEKNLDQQIIEKLIEELKKENSLQYNCKPLFIAKEGEKNLSQMILPPQEIELKDTQATKVIFFGPVGTGKTSLIQKIAFDFAINQKKKVLIVSLDNFKIQSALEHQRFAHLTKIYFENIIDLSTMEKTLEKHSDKNLILFDTSGINPLKCSEVEELLEIVRQISPQKLLLVLSALSRIEDLFDVIEKFKDFPSFCLAFTGLDLTKRYGSILSASIKSEKPLSYLSFGRTLTGKFEKADTQRLIQLMFA